MTAHIRPDRSVGLESSWSVRRVDGVTSSGGRVCLVENARGERILCTGQHNAVVTPVDGAHHLVTTLDPARGVLTSSVFGSVLGRARDGEQRLDVQLISGSRTWFSLTRNQVRLGAVASVGFGDDLVRVRTALLTVERRARDAQVRLTAADEPDSGVARDLVGGSVRVAVAGGGVVVPRIGAHDTTLSVVDDVAVRVTARDLVRAVLADGLSALVLDPDAARAALTCEDGRAEVVAAGSAVITCVRTGWRVSADGSVVRVESSTRPGVGLCWDRATGTLRVAACPHRSAVAGVDAWRACVECGVEPEVRRDGTDTGLTMAGLTARWTGRSIGIALGDGGFTVSAGDRVRIRWAGKTFSIGGGRAVVADDTQDWYTTPDGRLVTGRCVVSAGRAVEGALDVSVRSIEHGWIASAWRRGAFVDDGRGLRTVLDDAGGVVCTPAARADCSAAVRGDGGVVVRAATATVELDRAGAVRVHDSDEAELRVRARRAGDPVRSTIACGDRFSVAVTDAAGGLTWTTIHTGSLISHSVRASGELIVSNSPSGADITATAAEVRVAPPGGRVGHVITA